MGFNFNGFLRFTWQLLSGVRDPAFTWTRRRLIILAAFYLAYPLLELVTWSGFAMDAIFFRGYEQVPVRAPVFIVGNPRSGTTLLHRLLSQDRDQFTTMRMWEVLFAPSILQRRLVRALTSLDRRLGSPLGRRVADVETGWQEQSVMHRVSLTAPEEDDYLLLHIWSALTIGLSSGLVHQALPYTYFDTVLSEPERARIMGFYRKCVQRHLWARGHRSGNKRYLAKNPALSPKLATVWEFFPDARVIYIVRNPLEMVPSYLDMMEFSWRTIGVPIEGDTLRDYILEMAEHWYTYPLRLFETVPQDKYAVVRYDDLEDDPEAVITAIYQRFGYDMSPAYADLLHRQAEKARKFRSRHDYSLQGVGLTREQIRDRFSEVFERFAFPPAETVDSGTGDVAWQESTEATGEAEAGLPLGLGSGGAGA
ncbi:MAG: sulfotransferase family protein [Anaerolineae bacterium]|jgi:omega-hydroxy-beta-dihydromenaquinone-9 sulfotransferase